MGFRGRFFAVFLGVALLTSPAVAALGTIQFTFKLIQTVTILASPNTSTEQRRATLLEFASLLESSLRGSYGDIAHWRNSLPATLESLQNGQISGVPILSSLPAQTRESAAALFQALVAPVLASETPEKFDYRISMCRAWMNHLIQSESETIGDLLSTDSTRSSRARQRLQHEISAYRVQFAALSAIGGVLNEVVGSNYALDSAKLNQRVPDLLRALTQLGPLYRKTGDMLGGFFHPGAIPAGSRTHSLAELDALFRQRFELSLEDAFSSFDPTPIPGGTLAEVHRATLKSNGKLVAVKFRRPGIVADLAQNYRAHQHLTLLGKMASANETSSAVMDLAAIHVDHFAVGYLRELDFMREAQAMTAFGSRHGRNYTRIPQPIPNLVAQDILVMEFIEGTPLEEIFKSGDQSRIQTAFQNFTQVMIDQLGYGHLHGDLTPPNISFDDQGRAILYDWGSSISLQEKFWVAMRMAQGLLGYAPSLLASAMYEMADPQFTATQDQLLTIVQRNMESARSKGTDAGNASQVLLESYLESHRTHGYRMSADYARVVRGVLPMVGILTQFSSKLGGDFVANKFQRDATAVKVSVGLNWGAEWLWRARSTPFPAPSNDACFSDLIEAFIARDL